MDRPIQNALLVLLGARRRHHKHRKEGAHDPIRMISFVVVVAQLGNVVIHLFSLEEAGPIVQPLGDQHHRLDELGARIVDWNGRGASVRREDRRIPRYENQSFHLLPRLRILRLSSQKYALAIARRVLR